jgi:hypothetical protein
MKKSTAGCPVFQAVLSVFHNYIRPHTSSDGKTPADKAGIEVKGKDKWMAMIQNASTVQYV